MQKIALTSGLLVTSALALAQTKPNVVMILMDDMGYGDLSLTGAHGHLTPSIDQLAQEGTFFSHCYVGAPVSSASRIGLLTGCYPHNLGFYGALLPKDTLGIRPEHYILPDLFHDEGYTCGAIGKWHVGHQFHHMPMQNGFDFFYGLPYSNDMWPVGFDGKPISANVTDGSNHKKNYPILKVLKGNTPVKEIRTMDDQAQLTTLYTEQAVNFIHTHKNSPFFLYMAHSMPHVPLAVSDKFKGKSKHGIYGDVMMEIDWSIGEVMKALKVNGIDENTIVIFSSDNGPWLVFGDNGGSNGGLREGKLTTFEGGSRVPCIIRWKNHVPSRVIKDQMISSIDFLPTLAAAIGHSLENHKVDGINILPYITGKTQDSQRKVFEYHFRRNKIEAVRDERYKLHFPHKYMTVTKRGEGGLKGTTERKTTDFELYDLYADPGEQFNIIDIHPEIAEKLKFIVKKDDDILR